MKNNKEIDSSSHLSSAKTNSSLINEDNDLLPNTRQRGGIKSKINAFQPQRHTVAVPLNSFSGISHNASFQSKLLFFNGGKPKKTYHYPIAHDKVITEEKDKKENILKKNTLNIEDKSKKTKIEKDDLDSNININKLLDANNISNDSNKNDDCENKINSTFPIHKKNTIYYSSSQYHTLSLDSKSSNFNKILPNEKKTEEKKISSIGLKLKSLKDQWDFQKILLDYNILDFTSKLK